MPNSHTDCTFSTCVSYFGYNPSKSVNFAFAVLFAITTTTYIFQGLLRKRWLGFTVAMVCGNALEAIGYVGRVLAHNDIFNQDPFLMQIVCLTIAPAFLAAGVYLCLSRIVVTFGIENSRIKAHWYPRIFVPCDVFSLILQAAGGGYASVRTNNFEDPKVGNRLMLAGLVVQVVTMFIFILLALDFTIRTTLRIKHIGTMSALDPRHSALRNSWAFKSFLIALSLSTLCIFTRCVYRVAELSEGWNGHLIKVQGLFIGLEGAVIVVASFLLTLFHPGFCFKEALEPEGAARQIGGRNWFKLKRNTATQKDGTTNIKAEKSNEQAA